MVKCRAGKFLHFVFITGIAKFSKIGVFSSMNNLRDISLSKSYGSLVGYTQNEIEEYFLPQIESTSQEMNISPKSLLKKIKDYYDGFSFDGVTKVYNPFSILNFFSDKVFKSYWYFSGSPSFIVNWMQNHKIMDPEAYRHIQVDADFTDSIEIERANPANFLFQSGYLTIEKIVDTKMILDYPNFEVLSALSKLYLERVYHIEEFVTLGDKIWQAIQHCDLKSAIDFYNLALGSIPYEDFANRNEFWYRSLFLMLLRGAGIIFYAEVHTHLGRSDLVIQFNQHIIVFEFKFAEDTKNINSKKVLAENQLQLKEYAKVYEESQYKLITAIIILQLQ